MRTLAKLAGMPLVLMLLLAVGGCGLKPDPPPQIPRTAFSGTGDLMARCMQYASQSYCEQEVWGGGER
jgi:hypothetical protein